MKREIWFGSAAAFGLAAALTTASAQERAVSLADSFQVGSNALCSAQLMAIQAGDGMFDRSYALVCRDAAAPVGRLYALRGGADRAVERLRSGQSGPCEEAAGEAIEGLGEVRVLRCAAQGGPARIAYLLPRGDRVYAAQGVAGYESALKVGLRSLALDRVVDTPVEIAVTEGSDASAFARTQAAQLSPEAALAEAYRRSNAGDYAAAVEFFAAAGRSDSTVGSGAEAMLNAALQQSNLGNNARAEELFEAAAPAAGADPVLGRMMRNYRAIHALNQGRPQAALELLSRPLPPVAGLDPSSLQSLEIDRALAERLNAEAAGAGGVALSGETLLPAERAEILDGQAAQLRGAAHRLGGDTARARAELDQALARLGAVRGGRIASAAWMRAQIMMELAALAEADRNPAEAERLYRGAVELVEQRYPSSPALMSSQAELAGFLVRTGREEEATALYRSVVDLAQETPAPSLKTLLAPYFALLARRSDTEGVAADMFRAGQALVRPGVAQTQAVLARELSGGTDAAAGLFRRALNLSREIERTRIALAGLSSNAERSDADELRMAELQQRLASLQELQVVTQAELAQYPRYRAVEERAIDLAALQRELRPGEGYLKVIVLDDSSYALFITNASARAFPIGMSAGQLDSMVTAIRDSIVRIENGQVVTYPFDVERSHQLYARLFSPVQAELASVTHLIFEPDGALLTLPPNLLVASSDSVAAYRVRASRPGGDDFDFTGIDWLGRRMDVTTAVSASAFRDVRNARPSDARRAYLGLGQNQPLDALAMATGTRGGGFESSTCQWPAATWASPISAAELVAAQGTIQRVGAGAQLLTGSEFTDVGVKRMEEIDEYRVIHFATHGLVTAPRPDCPAEPSLVTSFGAQESDGLLTFAEIFDLRLDADLVILSACDTAGSASVATTRAAGIASGGGTAMDGLVRAFVGAGSRTVLASHWPVPDDFSATQRLISGLFTAPAGTSAAEALQSAQRALMDDPQTSHPYYWSAFAIVGDGTTPVIRTGGESAAAPADRRSLASR